MSPIKFTENYIYLALFCLVGLVGIWLQTEIAGESDVIEQVEQTLEPDYYIENFTATGFGENGERSYILEAERMAHFPHDGTALLDKPYVVEYFDGSAPRHTNADSGWLSSDGDELLLTGNVVIQQGSGEQGSGSTVQAQRLRILLDESAQAMNF